MSDKAEYAGYQRSSLLLKKSFTKIFWGLYNKTYYGRNVRIYVIS